MSRNTNKPTVSIASRVANAQVGTNSPTLCRMVNVCSWWHSGTIEKIAPTIGRGSISVKVTPKKTVMNTTRI